MTAARLVGLSLVAPLAFLGVDTAALRGRTRSNEREESREEVARGRRDWFVPSAYATDDAPWPPTTIIEPSKADVPAVPIPESVRKLVAPYRVETRVVQWHMLPDLDTVEVVCRALDAAHHARPQLISGRILGCTDTHSAPGVCVEYMVNPKSDDYAKLMATVGHEIKHCYDGDWHDPYGNPK